MLEAKLLKRYPGFTLEVFLSLPEGKTTALLGPSGSGKSTLLKLLAGLIPPDEGWVRLGGKDLTHLPPERRKVGVLFQDYALFPHLTVHDNIAFGLVEARWPREALRARVGELLEKTGLTPHALKKPQALSGGEQQRVALARALAPRPSLLLLDEPLGALDLRLREELLFFLRRILQKRGWCGGGYNAPHLSAGIHGPLLRVPRWVYYVKGLVPLGLDRPEVTPLEMDRSIVEGGSPLL